jgi:hypothetical protein
LYNEFGIIYPIFGNNQEKVMKSSQTFRPSSLENWITICIWAVAMLFLFTRPWQISAIELNTETFIFSTFGPTWVFLLVCLLAVPVVWPRQCQNRSISTIRALGIALKIFGITLIPINLLTET